MLIFFRRRKKEIPGRCVGCPTFEGENVALGGKAASVKLHYAKGKEIRLSILRMRKEHSVA